MGGRRRGNGGSGGVRKGKEKETNACGDCSLIVSLPHGVAAHVNRNKQRRLPISSLLAVCRRTGAGASFPPLEPVKGKIRFLSSSMGFVDVSEAIRVSGPTSPASKVHGEWTKR